MRLGRTFAYLTHTQTGRQTERQTEWSIVQLFGAATSRISWLPVMSSTTTGGPNWGATTGQLVRVSLHWAVVAYGMDSGRGKMSANIWPPSLAPLLSLQEVATV